MKLLLHTCCGPCLVYPYTYLKEQGFETTAYFYNPNIHPFREFKRRLTSLQDLSSFDTIPLVVEKEYGYTDFARKVVFNEEKRCSICYSMRLKKTVHHASKNGFTAFTTTLLYSKYQNHSLIIEKCNEYSLKYGIDFIYFDFREGWQRGIDESLRKQLYRQPYCGCIYSEQERYDKSLRKK